MRLATQLVASYPMRAQHWHALVKQKKERQINILQDLQDDTTIEPRMPTNQGYSAANEEFVMDMSKSDGRSPAHKDSQRMLHTYLQRINKDLTMYPSTSFEEIIA